MNYFLGKSSKEFRYEVSVFSKYESFPIVEKLWCQDNRINSRMFSSLSGLLGDTGMGLKIKRINIIVLENNEFNMYSKINFEHLEKNFKKISIFRKFLHFFESSR